MAILALSRGGPDHKQTGIKLADPLELQSFQLKCCEVVTNVPPEKNYTLGLQLHLNWMAMTVRKNLNATIVQKNNELFTPYANTNTNISLVRQPISA